MTNLKHKVLLAESVNQSRRYLRDTTQFDSCTSDTNVMAHLGAVLVLFELRNGRPHALSTLQCLDLSAHAQHGVVSEWSHAGKVIEVDNTPAEVADGVWLWHPQRGLSSYLPETEFGSAGSWATTLHIHQTISPRYVGTDKGPRLLAQKEFAQLLGA
jgi:hypothetical protein